MEQLVVVRHVDELGAIGCKGYQMTASAGERMARAKRV